MNNEKFNEIFPLKFPRNGQREIIERIINAYESGKRFVILDAPTGIGKSVIGYSVARYYKEAYILTSQKILQDQYFKDFKIPFVLGRSNYTCQRNENLNCELGACFRDVKKACKNAQGALTCPYLVARSVCLGNNYSNLNYSYFLSISEIKNYIQPRELIICDECHNLESELIKHCSTKITEKLLSYIGLTNVKIPLINDSTSNKCAWLIHDLYEELKTSYLYLKQQTKELSELRLTREYKKIQGRYAITERLLISIESLKKQIENCDKGSHEQKVIVTQTPEFIEFKSLFGINTFKNTLNQFGSRFLFMSASVLNHKVFCKNLGIDIKDTEYIRCESTFPVQNRLINFVPSGSMSFKNKNETLPKMIKDIDKILKKHSDVKGIIHTVNYDIAEKIIQGLAFSDQSKRLIMPRGTDKQIILDTFYASKKPYVLISPSLTEGIDLKEDLSRLCIICKVPYLNLTDNWIKERMNIDKDWYKTMACINLIQMTGRSIRSETDYANTYILDKDFVTLAANSMDIFPDWWKKAVITN